MTDVLMKLFGSAARVKLLRLFLFNPRQSFTIADAATRARVDLEEARDEITMFARIELVERVMRGKGIRYGLNNKFPYLLALQNLLLNAPMRGNDIMERVRGVGALKLVVIAGVFVGEWDTRLDLFVVGDRIKERAFKDRIRLLESEIGKEVRYAALPSSDFLYRLNMNDRLVRDIFDYPHKIVYDRFDIGLK